MTGNEEMIAELKAQILVKETRMRTLARYAEELRSLAYQMRQLMAAKAAVLAAR